MSAEAININTPSLKDRSLINPGETTQSPSAEKIGVFLGAAIAMFLAGEIGEFIGEEVGEFFGAETTGEFIGRGTGYGLAGLVHLLNTRQVSFDAGFQEGARSQNK